MTLDKKNNFLAIFQLIFLLLSAFLFGFFSGNNFQKWQILDQRDPPEIGDFSEKVPLFHFQKIENGILYGDFSGVSSRILVGEEDVFPISPGKFNFSVVEILPNLKKIPAPQGKSFVASKRGKYFYPLDSPRAALITVKNRIFFENEEKANAAGFSREKE